ncbi:hypothetical protein CHUAL_011838 [Chamberlinius hualienensis]
MDHSSGLNSRVLVNDLIINSKPVLVVGAVVLKNEPRSITTIRGNPSHLLTFMIRDSATSSVICNCWGSKEYIASINCSFNIGDIVEIRNCQVRIQSENENASNFKPFTSSSFQLVISDKCGTVSTYCGNRLLFDSLMNIPVKMDYRLVKLEEITQNPEIYENQIVDLLVLFKRCHTPKEIKTKTGKLFTKADIIVGDQTASNFAVQIWDTEWIAFAQKWTPNQCIILIQDVKLQYNHYLRKIVGNTINKTIFTVNPDTREAHILYLFAQSKAAEVENSDEINLEDIRETYLVHKLNDKINKLSNPREEKICGILFGVLTHFDLDGPFSLISTKCKLCGRMLDKETTQCVNQNCPSGNGVEATIAIEQIDLKISISDHSGTMKQCRLSGSVAEAFLGYKVKDLMEMNDYQLTMLKWKFLLERFKWYFQTFYNGSSRSTDIRILNGLKVDLTEWCSNMCT